MNPSFYLCYEYIGCFTEMTGVEGERGWGSGNGEFRVRNINVNCLLDIYVEMSSGQFDI